MDDEKLIELTAEEVRVLGALIEKGKTTPDYYPMTLNGVRTACNQKTSRNPIVDYDEGTIIQILDSLRQKGLVGNVVGGGSRVTKYRHNLRVQYSLDEGEVAILCLLFLRGPLTAGEINSNAGRLYDFDNLEEVNEKLQTLQDAQPPFIQKLARKSGQKEMRYVHLYSPFDKEAYQAQTEISTPQNLVQELQARVTTLEEQLAQLREEFDALMKELK